MRFLRCSAVVVTIILPLVGLVVTACTQDISKPPPAGNPSRSPVGSPTSGGGGGGGGGGTPMCGSVVNGPFVKDRIVAAEIAPPTGGSIASGTYQLAERNTYVGDSGVTMELSTITANTILIDGQKYQEVDAVGDQDAGLGKESRVSGVWMAVGTTFDREGTCGADMIPVGYSAENGTLRLQYMDDEYVFKATK